MRKKILIDLHAFYSMVPILGNVDQSSLVLNDSLVTLLQDKSIQNLMFHRELEVFIIAEPATNETDALIRMNVIGLLQKIFGKSAFTSGSIIPCVDCHGSFSVLEEYREHYMLLTNNALLQESARAQNIRCLALTQEQQIPLKAFKAILDIKTRKKKVKISGFLHVDEHALSLSSLIVALLKGSGAHVLRALSALGKPALKQKEFLEESDELMMCWENNYDSLKYDLLLCEAWLEAKLLEVGRHPKKKECIEADISLIKSKLVWIDEHNSFLGRDRQSMYILPYVLAKFNRRCIKRKVPPAQEISDIMENKLAFLERYIEGVNKHTNTKEAYEDRLRYLLSYVRAYDKVGVKCKLSDKSYLNASNRPGFLRHKVESMYSKSRSNRLIFVLTSSATECYHLKALARIFKDDKRIKAHLIPVMTFPVTVIPSNALKTILDFVGVKLAAKASEGGLFSKVSPAESKAAVARGKLDADQGKANATFGDENHLGEPQVPSVLAINATAEYSRSFPGH